MKRSTIFLVISLFALFIFASCGGGGGSDSGDGTPMMWTWMSGSDTTNQIGVYPILFSVPGARYDSVSWTDSADNLWLFGGYGLDLSGSTGHLNDLWRFDGTYWTWMSGIATIDNLGVYGIMGSPEASNMPGARDESVSWTDSTDNLWLFGGRGYPGSGGTSGLLNDLWRFDGTYWTWMLGDSTINSPGVYGTMGSPEASNVPGARYESVSWTDSADNLWLFGGFGYDGSGGVGWLNDLWRFDGTYWTWMSGRATIDNVGVYGIMGSPEASNVPGARYESVSWMDNSGNLWLFGGSGYGGSGGVGWLNDLWRFDGAYWTWMSGSNTLYSPGVYGIMGSPEASNVPGARYGSLSWTDNAGNLWLFGGFGYDGSGNWGFLNDLWRFDGTYWTWMSGDSTINISGAYGTLGSPEASNVPGGRYDSVSWMDSSGNMWLFGGNGYDGSGSNGWLNDLWRYNL